MNTEKIGKFIAELRKEKNMTQKELADKLHVTDSAISKWERGVGCPDISLLDSLGKVLDVSINEILAGERIEKITKNKSDRIFKYSIEYFQKKYFHKKIKLLLLVMSTVVFIIVLFGIMDCYRASNEKKPIFSYFKADVINFDSNGKSTEMGYIHYGVGYSVIECIKPYKTTYYIFKLGHTNAHHVCFYKLEKN